MQFSTFFATVFALLCVAVTAQAPIGPIRWRLDALTMNGANPSAGGPLEIRNGKVGFGFTQNYGGFISFINPSNKAKGTLQTKNSGSAYLVPVTRNLYGLQWGKITPKVAGVKYTEFLGTKSSCGSSCEKFSLKYNTMPAAGIWIARKEGNGWNVYWWAGQEGLPGKGGEYVIIDLWRSSPDRAVDI